MPTMDKNGNVTLTAKEFADMQKGTSQEDTPKKGLAKWGDFFKSKPAEPNQQQQRQPNAPLTRESLAEATKGIQFFNPTPDQLAKIQAGDFTAMIEAQNQAMQRVFIDSTLASDAMTKNSSTSSRADLEAMVAQQLSRQEGARAIRDKTKDILSRPGGEQIVAALTSHFSSANPNQSGEEIGSMVQEYVSDFTADHGQMANKPDARVQANLDAQKDAADF